MDPFTPTSTAFVDLNSFPVVVPASVNDEIQWKQQVSASLVYLMRAVEDLREENRELKLILARVQLASETANQSVDKLPFNSANVQPRIMREFDPLNPNRAISLGAVVADVANGHNLNECTYSQVIQPITTGVIRKLFEADAEKYTYTEDSIGKGRPARYAKIPTEFIKELSEAICDGFAPTPEQRSQLMTQARTAAGTVAKNFFNNVRSHRKKSQNSSDASNSHPNSVGMCEDSMDLQVVVDTANDPIC